MLASGTKYQIGEQPIMIAKDKCQHEWNNLEMLKLYVSSDQFMEVVTALCVCTQCGKRGSLKKFFNTPPNGESAEPRTEMS